MNAIASRFNATLFGPFPRFVGIPDAIPTIPVPSGYRSEICEASVVDELDAGHWSYAIGRPGGELRLLKAVAITWQGNQVVGIAMLTCDSERLSQIGIDVDISHRGHGIGSMMTAALGTEALTNDSVLYYGTTAANITSMRTALSAGFRPGWVESFTRHTDLAASGWLTSHR